MELTEAEVKVLTGISFNAEEIKNGDLNDDELAMLSEMRAVADYLKEKYPSNEFEITGCEPKSGTVKPYNEWYYRAKEIDRESAFIARAEDKDGKLLITDDFYSELIRKPVQDELVRILSENRLPVVFVNADFWEYFGKEYGADIAAADVLKGKVPAGNDIKIFLDGSKLPTVPYESTVSKIEGILKKEEITGDVYIVVLKSADGDLAKDRLYSDSIML